MISLLLSIFISAVPPEPLFFRHHMTRDDASLFHAISYEWEKIYHERPPIVFVYNYFDIARQLRVFGLRTYSMTIVIGDAHVKGQIQYMPFQNASLAALVILFKPSLDELAHGIRAIGELGHFLIEPAHLPDGGDTYLEYLGFKKRFMFWHEFMIYQRVSSDEGLLQHGAIIQRHNAFRIQPMGPEQLNRRGRLLEGSSA